jgi:hypothetical protein
MLLEMMDRRVRAAGDIVAVLGLPVVGIMPKPNAKRRRTTMALPRESTAALALPTPQGS